MRIVILPTAGEAVERAVDLIAAQLRAVPHSVLGLATGGTMEPVYDGLIRRHRAGLEFAGATTFNLDEYVGLGPDHPQSYAHYMRERLFRHVDIDPANCFVPSGLGDPAASADAFEALIAGRGALDLQLLGLGANGHIGFNEPGSSLGSRTREKLLSPDTIEANRRFFAEGETVPETAVTMGIATIREARSILVLATGHRKAAAVRAMAEGAVTAFCPASILQMHPQVQVVIDAEAASELALKDHYLRAEEIQSAREARR
ncbi:glucosamine-6-phosphate deaminase [Paracoccus zeaxanthinifaciens]|uniref:glucosamine-6-phosphate deaminase n=1 Tax=Paracoccus zeaxanthinifaciens TaxID=187400 RepID=UPI0003B3ECAC|nr:glucosamine-6-phosphate deaminase [Paracoccus zeaxanthinifaciens]